MVILPDGTYVVRRRSRPSFRDAHGLPVPGSAVDESPEVEGAANKQRDGTWSLRLDGAAWPVHAGDLVVRPADGTVWTVYGAPKYSPEPFNFVSCIALLQTPEVDRGQPA